MKLAISCHPPIDPPRDNADLHQAGMVATAAMALTERRSVMQLLSMPIMEINRCFCLNVPTYCPGFLEHQAVADFLPPSADATYASYGDYAGAPVADPAPPASGYGSYGGKLSKCPSPASAASLDDTSLARAGSRTV